MSFERFAYANGDDEFLNVSDCRSAARPTIDPFVCDVNDYDTRSECRELPTFV